MSVTRRKKQDSGVGHDKVKGRERPTRTRVLSQLGQRFYDFLPNRASILPHTLWRYSGSSTRRKI
jgi:hypothetical protein